MLKEEVYTVWVDMDHRRLMTDDDLNLHFTLDGRTSLGVGGVRTISSFLLHAHAFFIANFTLADTVDFGLMYQSST